ncbi:Altered inheritance of mitochondria protein 32 like [Verticillium longisporum]|nr:Altered inheritance of mitochondria protein 32 like [Verticillium longisporum]
MSSMHPLQQQQQQPRHPASAPDPPFATIPTCPAPTCSCAPTPPGLDIDHTSPLNGVISGYAEQVLVCTGRDDWASRIEEEDSGDNLAADLKELFGRGGTYSDPFHNVSVLNASFPSSTPRRRAELQTTSAYLLPSFKYVPFLPRVSFESVQALVKGYLLPEALHPVHDGLSPVHRDRLLRKEAYREMLYGVQDVQDVLVLICGHDGRDARCGITGPVLRSEFETQLDAAGVSVLKGERGAAAARVGLISHIGGHKFAGNVIVYVPPGMKAQDGTEHGLAGKGIWYGRVEPRHAEGIVKETILGGRVIADMFRGGIDQQRKILRIHIGGHKFAGNVIVYVPPGMRAQDGTEHGLAGRGIWYGRVEPRHVEGIVKETILGGRVIADMFRGGIDQQRKMLRM